MDKYLKGNIKKEKNTEKEKFLTLIKKKLKLISIKEKFLEAVNIRIVKMIQKSSLRYFISRGFILGIPKKGRSYFSFTFLS